MKMYHAVVSVGFLNTSILNYVFYCLMMVCKTEMCNIDWWIE